jgi:murein DD-endopeptidase MepM/ murein hydrolase activator NlpD
VKNPEIVFIPGLNWGGKIQQDKNYQGLTYYPLSEFRPVGLNYGWQQKGNKKFFHSGVDLLTDLSNSVFAVDDGIVVFVGQEPEYGLLIVINHTNGRQTRYAHLSRVNVTIEDSVIGGSLIGQVGNSGNPDITEPHLHFEVRVQTPQGWITQDPILNLPQN